jgi:hypothetical protein
MKKAKSEEDPILIDANSDQFPVDIGTEVNAIRKEYPALLPHFISNQLSYIDMALMCGWKIGIPRRGYILQRLN